MHDSILQNPTPEHAIEQLATFIPGTNTGPAREVGQYFSEHDDAYVLRSEDTLIEVAVTEPTTTEPGAIEIVMELIWAGGSTQYSNNGRELATDYVELLADASIPATATFTGDWYTLEFDPYTYQNKRKLARIYNTAVYHILTLVRLRGDLEVPEQPIDLNPQEELPTRLSNDEWTVDAPPDLTTCDVPPEHAQYAEAVLIGGSPGGCWTARIIDPDANDDILTAQAHPTEQEAVEAAVGLAEARDIILHTTRRDLRDQ